MFYGIRLNDGSDRALGVCLTHINRRSAPGGVARPGERRYLCARLSEEGPGRAAGEARGR